MPTITIEWVEFTTNRTIIDEETYMLLKELIPIEADKFLMPNYNFFNPLLAEFVILLIGGFCGLLILKNDVKEPFNWIFGLIFIAGVVMIPRLFLSIWSYTENYFDDKKYFKFLKKSIVDCPDYISFCKTVVSIDWRYSRKFS